MNNVLLVGYERIYKLIEEKLFINPSKNLLGTWLLNAVLYDDNI